MLNDNATPTKNLPVYIIINRKLVENKQNNVAMFICLRHYNILNIKTQTLLVKKKFIVRGSLKLLRD